MKIFWSSLILIGLSAIIIGSFFLGKLSQRPSSIIQRDTVMAVKYDTVIKNNVIPKYVTLKRVDTLYIEQDSMIIPVQIPINEYNFKDTSYSATLTGYDVELKHIEIYNKNIYQTITNTKEVRVKNKWGIGVYVGYGVGIMDSKIKMTPHVGVGIYRNIWSF